jgi:hypothetical protein
MNQLYCYLASDCMLMGACTSYWSIIVFKLWFILLLSLKLTGLSIVSQIFSSTAPLFAYQATSVRLCFSFLVALATLFAHPGNLYEVLRKFQYLFELFRNANM